MTAQPINLTQLREWAIAEGPEVELHLTGAELLALIAVAEAAHAFRALPRIATRNETTGAIDVDFRPGQAAAKTLDDALTMFVWNNEP